MTAPTPTEERLRAMLVELADSTPVRTEPMVLPTAVVGELDDRPGADPAPDERGDRDREEHSDAHEIGELAGGGETVVLGGPDGSPGLGARGRSDGLDEVSAARVRRSGGSRLAWVLTAVAGVLVVVMAVTLLRVGDAADPFARDPSDVPAVDLGALAGGRLAFVMDNDLFVADAPDGVTRRITDVGRGNEVSDVSWSHDGEWVAFTVHDQEGIWVVRRDGSERHRLPGRTSSYTWSPTNDELVYATADEVRVGQVDGTWRALEGGQPPAGYTYVVWSPDGNRVAFAGAAGNLAIGTPEGRPGAGWGTRVSPPVHRVVAWPRDDHLVVEQLNTDSPLLSFDPATSRSTPLAVLDHGVTGTDVIGIDPTGTRMVILTDAEIWLCPLDQGADAPCAPRGEPGIDLSSPRFVPGTDDLSVIFTYQPRDGVQPAVPAGTARPGSALLVSFSLVSEPSQDAKLVEGRLDQARRGTIDLGGISHGVEPEAQIPIAGGFLVRVDEGRIESVSASRQDAPHLVVAGNRFLPPADDYPGGSGLAYWHP